MRLDRFRLVNTFLIWCCSIDWHRRIYPRTIASTWTLEGTGAVSWTGVWVFILYTRWWSCLSASFCALPPSDLSSASFLGLTHNFESCSFLICLSLVIYSATILFSFLNPFFFPFPKRVSGTQRWCSFLRDCSLNLNFASHGPPLIIMSSKGHLIAIVEHARHLCRRWEASSSASPWLHHGHAQEANFWVRIRRPGGIRKGGGGAGEISTSPTIAFDSFRGGWINNL